jgi:enoyl-CoA hydratase/carnithine racemase
MERDERTGIARITLDNPERRNAYDARMREQLGAYLDELALDDGVKVVLLRGEGGVFSTGADMAHSYSWYGKDATSGSRPDGDRPSGGDGKPSSGRQRRRRRRRPKTFGFYTTSSDTRR